MEIFSAIGAWSAKRTLFLRRLLLAGPLILLIGIIYSNTLHSPFVFDDRTIISHNDSIKIETISWDSLIQAGFTGTSRNRPVAGISFALNYYFHGENLVGYHLVNIFIHTANAILLYYLLLLIFQTPALAGRYKNYEWLAFAAALIWAVHPLHTQSITYIVQRMSALATMFCLLTVICYSRARSCWTTSGKVLFFSASLATAILALGSKEIAITLPFFIFVYEYYFFQDLKISWFKRHAIYSLIVLAVLVGSCLWLVNSDYLQGIITAYQTRNFTMPQRVLTEFRVVVFYLSELFYPHPDRLNLFHRFPVSTDLFTPITTFSSWATLIGIFIVAILLAQRYRLISFAILWYLGNLVLESSIVSLALIFEHRTYLPSLFFSVVLVLPGYELLRRNWARQVLLWSVVAVLSFWTYERNQVWHDEEILLRDCLTKAPNVAKTNASLGYVLSRKGQVNECIHYYREALRLRPSAKDAAKIRANLEFIETYMLPSVQQQHRQDN